MIRGFPRRHQRDAEPGAALFARLRLRLTLWYSGVLGGALLLAGLGLYLGLQEFLLRPVEDNLGHEADFFARVWQESAPNACPLPPAMGMQEPPPGAAGTSKLALPLLAACFDAEGNVIAVSPELARPETRLAVLETGGPVELALDRGKATDIVDGGDRLGAVYRYTIAVPGPNGQGQRGAILLAQSVEERQAALTTLRNLLLALSVAALAIAAGGGFFLANRALVPARLAFARQRRFVADASHELRTPLALLRANAEVLLRGRQNLPPDDAMLLEDIVTETDQLGKLASDLLALARLDADPTRHEREVVDLGDLAGTVLHRMATFAASRGVALRTGDEAHALVIGDRQLLEQAALILLDNAVKYTPAGGCVTVDVAVRDDRALLVVRDTGIGIAPEHLAHLGERFYRVDKARSREAGGAGLGLAIARGIMSMHDGTLRIESAPGVGTTAVLGLLALAGVARVMGDAVPQIESDAEAIGIATPARE